MFAAQCSHALELTVPLMALVIFSDSGSVTVLCTYMLPSYTQSVIKLPVVLQSEHCMFGMVCKGESQTYCVSRASITFLIAVHFSVQRTSVKARSQEPLAATLRTPGDADVAEVGLVAWLLPRWLRAGPMPPSPHRAHPFTPSMWPAAPYVRVAVALPFC